MKVLWLLNICPPAAAEALGRPYSVREGWITGLLHQLLHGQQREESGFRLALCFPQEVGQAPVKGTFDLEGIPVELYSFGEDLVHPETETPGMEAAFREILEICRPDLVHIFGTEFAHASAMVRAYHRPERTLVGLQGMMGQIAEGYLADLPEKALKHKTFRDIVKKDTILGQQEKFVRRAAFEKETLQGAGHVSGRTAFDRASSLAINDKLIYHRMNETMRPIFYENTAGGQWSKARCQAHRIFLSQGDYPLKGFHYVLQALPEILKKYPDTTVAVAGNSITGYSTWKEKLKISGYGDYLRRLMKEHQLEEHVEVLGILDAAGMKKNFLQAEVFVCPSSIENSPNSVGEAMLLGVPCVLSRTGGIVDLAVDGESALYFEKGNVTELAEKILALFDAADLEARISAAAREKAAQLYDGTANSGRLPEIYQEILRS